MSAKDALIHKLDSREAVIGIVGLGYVGLPLMLRYTEVGYRVLGFDIDPKEVALLNEGQTYIEHIGAEGIAKAVQQGFEATTDFMRAGEADALILCVPTPLDEHLEPDLSYVLDTTEELLPAMRAGQVVSLESTTYPGTTDEELLPRIESRDLRVGEDVFLVYSPEREDPGNPNFNTRTIPKVCGGVTEGCRGDGQAAREHSPRG